MVWYGVTINTQWCDMMWPFTQPEGLLLQRVKWNEQKALYGLEISGDAEVAKYSL